MVIVNDLSSRQVVKVSVSPFWAVAKNRMSGKKTGGIVSMSAKRFVIVCRAVETLPQASVAVQILTKTLLLAIVFSEIVAVVQSSVAVTFAVGKSCVAPMVVSCGTLARRGGVLSIIFKMTLNVATLPDESVAVQV